MPDYRPMLREYLKFAEKGHEPQSMRAALAMHDTFLKKGDMIVLIGTAQFCVSVASILMTGVLGILHHARNVLVS